jgi:hypothetical protein
MEYSVSKWFNESIEEFHALVDKLKIGRKRSGLNRTGFDNKSINYIK